MSLRAKKIVIMIGVPMLFVFFVVQAFSHYLSPVNPRAEENLYVDIERGMSAREISFMLYEKKLIRSPYAFQIYSLLIGSLHSLQAGSYFLSPALSSRDIIRIIATGFVGRSVVIPEGATIKDIDSILSSAGILASGELVNADWSFLKTDYPFLASRSSLEGYLFPDTYQFERNSNVKMVLKKFLANFSRKTSQAFPDLTYNHLIIASIIEKEVYGDEDRALVSDILWKRFDANRGLDVDATLVYIKCDGAFISCANRAVGSLDKELRSPYNTYMHAGLPPTPIGNPGAHAMQAAMNPKKSPYWYYLSAKGTGETIFSKTLDEHNDNRLQYL